MHSPLRLIHTAKLGRASQIQRRYATTHASNTSNNTLLFVAGIAAAAGGYYYLRGYHGEEDLAKVKREEEIMAQKARESLSVARQQAEDVKVGALSLR